MKDHSCPVCVYASATDQQWKLFTLQPLAKQGWSLFMELARHRTLALRRAMPLLRPALLLGLTSAAALNTPVRVETPRGSHKGAPVLSLYDEKSSSRVVLVGTMHFNPASIALAESVIRSEAEDGRLRAVAIESCPTRWNATQKTQPAGSVLRSLLDNEMQAAAECGEELGAETALVDQQVEETVKRLAQCVG